MLLLLLVLILPMSVPKSISRLASGETYKLIIRAKPGARKSQIVSIDDQAIGVQLAAPPRDGAANEELIGFMSQVLGVRPRCITLHVGAKSRNKTLTVSLAKTTTPESVMAMITDSMDGS